MQNLQLESQVKRKRSHLRQIEIQAPLQQVERVDRRLELWKVGTCPSWVIKGLLVFLVDVDSESAVDFGVAAGFQAAVGFGLFFCLWRCCGLWACGGGIGGLNAQRRVFIFFRWLTRTLAAVLGVNEERVAKGVLVAQYPISLRWW